LPRHASDLPLPRAEAEVKTRPHTIRNNSPLITSYTIPRKANKKIEY
jgi:hypothetical protein